MKRIGGGYLWLIISLILLPGSSPAGEEGILPPGAYRLDMIMATTSHVPVFGTSKSASKSVSLVAIRKNGSELIQSHQVCDFRVLDDSAFIKIVFPEKFIAALGKHTYPIQLERTAQGWLYRADLGIERIGYKAQPGNGELPTSASDPSVNDWDGDGQPGATLQISIPLFPDGQIYVVQKGHSILNGYVTPGARVEGRVEVRTFEQRMIGATPAIYTWGPAPRIEPDSEQSRFSITPVPPGTNCESLRKALSKQTKEDAGPERNLP